jgi:hypothetical protein
MSGHVEPGYFFERWTSGNVASPVAPFQAAFGDSSPSGGSSGEGLRLTKLVSKREATSHL